MTPQVGEVMQVVGRARAGDPVTATAVAWHAERVSQDRPSRIAAADPGTMRSVEVFDAADVGAVVVHSVDGGEDLAEIVDDLAARPLTLVHHGSAAGSERRVLRALRTSTERAVAADPAAREELRGLGYRNVELVDAGDIGIGLTGVVPDAATAENLARHPGVMLLCVGPVRPAHGIELLMDAFADVLTHSVPSAVLSLCGPSAPWYRGRLLGHAARHGLQACEVVHPRDEGEVVARLERTDAVVALRPRALDPYLQAAASRGVPIIAPADARTAWIAREMLVPIAAPTSRAALAAAIEGALT